MIRHTLNQLSICNGKLREALAVLDDADQYCDLHVACIICIFVSSAALSVYLGFHLIELCIWLGIDKLDPLIPAFLSYIMLFVAWVLIFLATLSTLEAIGIRSIRPLTQARLLELTLNTDELNGLRDAVANRNWRHSRVFKIVVASLAEE